MVLFRSYNDSSQGTNSSQEFIASKFQDHDVLPLPLAHSDHGLFAEIRKHITQDKEYESRLISTCSCLIRTMRRAIKGSQKVEDIESCRISIIDSQMIGQNDSVFYARPYRDFFRREGKFPYRYTGWEEYLVWGSIPGHAILADIPLQELLESCDQDPVLSRVLDRNIASRTTILLVKDLKEKQVPLSPELIAAIAQLISFLGLQVTSPPAIIAKLVCEIVHGWCFVLPTQSITAWIADATIFTRAFIASQGFVIVDDEDSCFRGICEAFLAGGRTSTKKWAAHLEIRQDQANKIISKAIQVGLLSLEDC